MPAPDPSATNGLDGSWWDQLWSTSFMPHGCCYLWQPWVVWCNAIADATICLAYYSIPIILFAFVHRRRDVPFNAIFIIFGIFIMACGTTHLLEVVNIWEPFYRLSVLVKIITAIVSVTAVIMLIPVISTALALPSLRTANLKLEKITSDLRRSNAELEQFAYIASHDLQEPLRMISIHVDLLQQQHGHQLDAKGRNYVRIVGDSAERMRRLVASLLAFARIDQVPLATAPIPADLALQDALANLSAAIAGTGAVITHAPLPAVLMDRGQLTHVFQNLVGNAIKFRAGERSHPTVAIRAERRPGEVVISVEDDGIGVDPEYHHRIFTVFFRLHEREQYDGSGIGLASVKKIVERQGGRIWLDSTLGHGATFHFSIPDGTGQPPAASS